MSWPKAGLAFTATDPGHNTRGYLLESTTGKVRPITPEGARNVLLSPSGTLVYADGANLRPTIFSLDGGPAKPISLGPDESPVGWDEADENLYVWSGVFPAQVYLVNINTGARKLWKELAPLESTGILWGRILIAPDGKSYMYRYRQSLRDLYLVDGIR